MSYVSKMLPVVFTIFGATAQAQTTPYSATVIEDPNTGNYVKTNVIVEPSLVESHFGDKKVWVFGGGTSAVAQGRHTELKGAKTNDMTLGLSLSAGQFVAKNVLVGLQGGISASFLEGSNKFLSARVGPFAGYNVRITDHSSFLPTLGVNYGYTQSWGLLDGHNNTVDVELGLNFALNVTRHVNMLVGPYVAESVYNNGTGFDGTLVAQDGPWITTYGLRASILGWH